MKILTSKRIFNRIGVGCLLLFAALAVTPDHAAANTAANTKIINTATVNYKDATGTIPQTALTATATVTVTLVSVTPTLSQPGDLPTTVGNAATYNYTITAGSNGPDTYNLSTSLNGGSIVNSANITASTAVPSVASVLLGATTLVTPITIPAATNTALVVPSDGVSDANVNGIAAGDTVVINSLVYSVISVVDNPAGTSTITVNGPASAALVYGTLIAEQKTFSVAVTPTAMNATVAAETVTTTISAIGSGAAAATDVTVTTVPAANLTVTKEVSLTGAAGTFATTANAASGTTLYYRITVHNGGASNATSVVITDPLTAYTSYVPGSGRRVTGAAAGYGGTVLTDDPLLPVVDNYDYNAGTTTVTYAAGTIATGVANDVQLFFTVLVK